MTGRPSGRGESGGCSVCVKVCVCLHVSVRVYVSMHVPNIEIVAGCFSKVASWKNVSQVVLWFECKFFI